MSDYIYIIIGAVVLALLAVLVIWLVVRHRHRAVPAAPATPPIVPAPAAPTPVPLDHQPVVPRDEAQGYGWLKASDLAKPE